MTQQSTTTTGAYIIHSARFNNDVRVISLSGYPANYNACCIRELHTKTAEGAGKQQKAEEELVKCEVPTQHGDRKQHIKRLDTQHDIGALSDLA